VGRITALVESHRRALATLAVGVALAAGWSSSARADPVVAAAGDIACDPDDPGYNGGAGTATRCRQRATSDLLVGSGLRAVLPLGDVQYNSASLANLNEVYDPTWGRVKSISRPILGNHEGSGSGYFDYFNGPGVANGPAGPRGKGYYSFNVGGWHLVALNSNCERVPCSRGSEQERWLRADLAAHRTSCTLAYSHHPRWSSGHDGSSTFMQPLWQALVDAGAEVLLSGHSHDYERFAPQDAGGRRDTTRGIRQFVVGTGGAFFTGGLGTRIANSEVAQNTTFGVLRLTLRPTSYAWRFVPVAGGGFSDSGATPCHGLVGSPPPSRPGVGSRRCLAQRARVGSLRLGRIGLGRTRRALLLRAPRPTDRGRRAWRYCVRGSRGRVLVGFSGGGRVQLVLSTARGHSRGRIRRGASVRRLRRAYSLRRRGPGTYAGTGRGHRVVFGVRRGRVRFVGVASVRLVARPRVLRRYTRLLGF
jgi:acid phosphatase type 7